MMGAAGVTTVRAMLGGGDRRSTGRADEAAAMVLEGTIPAAAFFEGMFDQNPLVRMRAADVLEKASARWPKLLGPFKDELLVRLPDIRQIEVRWHVAQILPRLNLTRSERRTVAVPVLIGYLDDRSRIVQTFALQALADFTVGDVGLRPRVLALIETASRLGSPAVKSRCRRLLTMLNSPARA